MPARAVELPRPDTSLHDTGPDTEDLGRAKRQRTLMEHWGFSPHTHLLEIGCGVGRLAYELSDYMEADGRYVGFDVKEKAVAWLNERYAPHLPNFQFDHLDVRNARYRPDAGAPAGQVRFPYADQEFDFACSYAVFMHMQLPEIGNYVCELHRVLRPGAIATITATAITEADYERGVLPTLGNRAFVPIGDGVYAKRPDQPTTGLGFDFALLAAVMEQAGFTLTRFVEGSWHSVEQRFSLNPYIGGDLFVLERNDDTVESGDDPLVDVRRATTTSIATGSIERALDELTATDRAERRSVVDERLVRLRYRTAGIHRFEPPDAPAAATVGPGREEPGIPEATRDDADPERIRQALADRGAFVVRDVVDADTAGRMATEIEQTIAVVDRRVADEEADVEPWFVPFRGDHHDLGGIGRLWELSEGRMWIADAPGACFDATELLARSGVTTLLASLLGDHPVSPVQRLAIARTARDVAPTWWQESYISRLDVGIGVSVCLTDDADGGAPIELIAQPPIPVQYHEHDTAKPPVGVQPEAIAALSDAPPVRVELRLGDVLLTHPSVLRRHQGGRHASERFSIEGLAVGAAWCPKDAHPFWW